MEVLIKPLNGCEYELELIVPQAELQPHFDKAYKKVRSKISFPGFRKGKVPIALLKQRFGKTIESDAIEEVSNELFKKAMEERDIKPIGQPHIHHIDYKHDKPLTLNVHYEVIPDVTAHDYKGIEIEKRVHEVTDDDIDSEIEYLREKERTLIEVQQAVDENHLATVDIQALDQSRVPIIGKKNEDIKIELNDERANRDLKAELLNMKTDEIRDTELTYERIDGTEVHEYVRIHLKKIERIILPELNDEFVKKMSGGNQKNIEQFRNDIGSSLKQDYERRSKNLVESEIVDEVVKRNPIDVPQSIVEKVLDTYLEQSKDRYPDKTLPSNFDKEQFKKSRRADAIWQTKWMLIRQSIIDQENLVVEDRDVEDRAEAEAARTGVAKERLIQFFKQSSETSDSILGGKVISMLLENAIIKEVDDNQVDESLIQTIPE